MKSMQKLIGDMNSSLVALIVQDGQVIQVEENRKIQLT
ncbi:DUF2292 domain-containing protein [Bacillus pumilus]